MSDPATSITSFTLADLNAGNVLFVHNNGMSASGRLELQAEDNEGALSAVLGFDIDVSNVQFGANGHDRLSGTNSGDFLWGRKGDDLIKGLGGKDTINDFENGKDKIDLKAFNFTSKAQALSKFYEIGSASNDKLGFDFKGTEIIIKGIDMDGLNGADIII